MCTLILGVDVAGPDTVIAGANRDEDPARTSDPPGLLRAAPHVVGGRDRRAGGTWLVVRGTAALVAMLNRRDLAPPPAAARSRGLLVLECAAVAAGAPEPAGQALARAALDRARAELREHAYAPFSMVFAAPGACWMIAHQPGQAPRVADIGPGWHVLTHAELDDPDEPRAARLLREIGAWRPRSAAEPLAGVAERLRGPGTPGEAEVILEGPKVTGSSFRAAL